MKNIIVCSPKALPASDLIAAARTAVEINPHNHPQLERLAAIMPGFRATPARIAMITKKYWGIQGVKLAVPQRSGVLADWCWVHGDRGTSRDRAPGWVERVRLDLRVRGPTARREETNCQHDQAHGKGANGGNGEPRIRTRLSRRSQNKAFAGPISFFMRLFRLPAGFNRYIRAILRAEFR